MEEKLTVTQLFKEFLAYLEPEDSLQCSQRPATGPSLEPVAYSPHLPTLFP